MALENAAIYEDVITSAQIPTEFSDVWEYLAEVVTPDRSIEVIKVLRYDVNRAHGTENSHYADLTTLVIRIGRRTYTEDIYPNRDNLNVKLRRKERAPTGGDLQYGEIQHSYFKATIMDAKDLDAVSQKKDNSDAALEELTDQMEIALQLIPHIDYEITMSMTAGAWRDVTVEEVLRITMGYNLNGKQSLDILNKEEYRGIRGVDVVPPTNKKRYEQIYIPTGVRTVDVPTYLQNRYGVYSSGIGYYLQSGRWYVYPLRDHTLFGKRRRTLTIVNIPEREMPGIERSHFYKGDKLFVVTTGRVASTDDTQKTMLNEGNGIRFFRSTDLLDNMSIPSDNRLVTRRDETLRQMAITERRDGLYNAEYVTGVFTDNPYKALSPKTSTLGKTLLLEWKKSDHTLLYPGMPVRLMYTKKGELVTQYGTLLGSHTTTMAANEGIAEKGFMSSTALQLFLTPETV